MKYVNSIWSIFILPRLCFKQTIYYAPLCHFSVPIGVPGATSGSMFTPIPVEITAYEPEVTGLDLLHKCKFTKLRQVETIPDLARISEGTTKLEVMLDAVISYVQGVLEGRETPNNAVGRKLLDLVNSVPKMNPDEFEKMINSNMKVCIIYN